MIAVEQINGKGRGLIATEAIPRGTVVSVCPIITMPAGSLDGTLLENHVWTEGDTTFLALGPQTLVNHSHEPNCVGFLHENKDFLVSIRAISAGEELTLDYSDFCDGWDGTP